MGNVSILMFPILHRNILGLYIMPTDGFVNIGKKLYTTLKWKQETGIAMWILYAEKICHDIWICNGELFVMRNVSIPFFSFRSYNHLMWKPNNSAFIFCLPLSHKHFSISRYDTIFHKFNILIFQVLSCPSKGRKCSKGMLVH